jgi:hypothetical protein
VSAAVVVERTSLREMLLERMDPALRRRPVLVVT